MAKTIEEIIREQRAANSGVKTVSTETVKTSETADASAKKNVGGLGGGLKYVGSKFLGGVVGGVEGISDFVVGGLADLLGSGLESIGIENKIDDWGEGQFEKSWMDYEKADKEYNPGTVMRGIGDVAGGIGSSVPSILTGAGVGLATGGAGLIPVVIGAIPGGLMSAGMATSEAYAKTGELSGKEYGAGVLSGLATGGLEVVTGGLFDAGSAKLGARTVQNLTKLGAKSAKISGLKVLGRLGKELSSEAVEEGIEAFLGPKIAQVTYDPDAPDATLGEIGYSALVGGLSGLLTAGASETITGAANLFQDTSRGDAISKNEGGAQNVIDNADKIVDYEEKGESGYEGADTIKRLKEELKGLLSKTGERVETNEEKRLLGALDAEISKYVLNSSFANSALNVARNAEAMAEALNAFYKKTGQSRTVTAESLTAGLDTSGSVRDFNRSVRRALNSNSTLREVVLNNMLGRMQLDAEAYADSIFGDVSISAIATQENINRFLANADDTTLSALGEALGIEEWGNITPEELAAKIRAFRDSGKATQYERAFREKVAERRSALSNTASGAATEAVDVRDYAALDRSLDKLASERIPEYKKLTVPEREAVREAMRRAKLNGLSVDDQILIGRISAKTGMNIFTVRDIGTDEKAFFDGENAIYIDASSPDTRTLGEILGHEMWHKMFKSKRAKKLFMSAFRNIDANKRSEVTTRYMEHYKMLQREAVGNPSLKGVPTTAQAINITNEEVAAAYAEELFNAREVWDYVLSEEPSLSEKVIAFFTVAEKRYSFDKRMPREARRWIAEYKKLFSEVASQNQARAAVENAGFGDDTKFVPKSVSEEQKNVPKSVKVVGKISENVIKNGENVVDSGRRSAIAGVRAKTANGMQLSTAKKMLENGADSETVRRDTGWFVGYDGKWRFEIDDSDTKITLPERRYTRLSEILDHPELFEAYPELAEIYVTIDDNMTSSGSYSRTLGDITISKDTLKDEQDFKEVLYHEVQHAIQDIEQFSRGASLEYWNRKLEEGFDSRQAHVKEQEKELLAQMRDIRVNEPEFLDDMELLDTFKPDHPRGKIDWDTLEQIEEDSPAWKNYDKRRKALEEKWGEEKVFRYFALASSLERLRDSGKRYPVDLYLDTAVEIEARDVAKRVNMNAEQRKNTRPDIDRTDVVFAESSDKSASVDTTIAGDPVVVVNDDITRYAKNDKELVKLVKQSIGKLPYVALGKQKIKFSRDTKNEVTFSKYTKTLRKKRPEIYKDKMRLFNHPSEIIIATTNYINEGLKHPRTDNIIDFARGEILVDILGKQYSAKVVIGFTKSGECELHDVVNLKPTTFAYKKRDAGLSAISQNSEHSQTRSPLNNSIPDSEQKSNSFSKKSSKKFDSGRRSALRKSPGGANSGSAMIGIDERHDLAKQLWREVKTDEERNFLSWYEGELVGMEGVLLDRSELLRELDGIRKEKGALYKTAKTKEDREALRESYAMKALNEQRELIQKRLDELDGEISRRDAELLGIAAVKPLHELILRAHKLGVDEGLVSKVTPGVIKKRIATMLHLKSFSKNDAKEIVAEIDRQFGLPDDWMMRDELAQRLWHSLNESDNRAEQKKVFEAFANDVIKIIYGKGGKTKGYQKEINFVRRFRKYRDSVVFAGYERTNITKYYTVAAENIFKTWEYKPGKAKKAYSLGDVLWDIGRIKGFEHYGALEFSSASDRSDAFYQLMSEFEAQEPLIDSFESEAHSDTIKIVDLLWREFETKGRETYKAKYEQLDRTIKIRNIIEKRVKAFETLEKRIFQNATQDEGVNFAHTLDEIPKMLYRGTVYPKRVRDVMKTIDKWYRTDNSMLCYIDEKNPGLYSEEIKKMLTHLSRDEGNVSLTLTEFEMLDAVLQYFYNFVETYNKVFKGGKWVDIKPLAEGFISKAQVVAEAPKPALVKLIQNKYVRTFGDSYSVMRLADGYEKGVFTDTFLEIRGGVVSAEVLEMRMRESYDEFLSKRENKKFLKNLSKETVKLRDVDITREALIGYYLSLKREQSRLGLAYNGFVFDNPDTKKGNKIEVSGFAKGFEYVDDPNATQAENAQRERDMIDKLALREISEVEGLFTAEEMKYIAIIEGIYAQAGQIKESADLKKYGYTNVSEGYYYPIRRYAAGGMASLDVFADMGTVDRFTNASFNKDTVKGAKQALYIESPHEVVTRHVRNLTLYAKLSPAVENFARIWRFDLGDNPNSPKSIKTFMEKSEATWRDGKSVVGFSYLQNLIGDIMGGKDNGAGFKIMSFLRGSYATYALGGVALGNPKVLMTQFSSILASTAILKKSSVIKSATVSGRDAVKYCELAALRAKDDTAVRAQGVFDEINEKRAIFTKAISMMDNLVVRRVFAACQVEVSKLGGKFALGTEANKIKAGELLTEVILKTQQNAIITEKTESMRSGNEFMKAFSMFRSDSVKMTGRIIDAAGEIWFLKARIAGAKNSGESKARLEKRLGRAKKNLKKSVGSVVAISAFMVMLAKAFDFAYAKEDDDDEAWILGVLKDFGGNMLGGLPVISQMYSYFVEGYDLEGFEYSMVNDVLSAVENFGNLSVKFMSGKATWEDLFKNSEKLIDASGQMLGVPTRNIRKTLYGLTKRVSGEVAYRYDDFFGRNKYSADLKDAIEANDTDMITTVLELATKSRLGSGLSEEAIEELSQLAVSGENVIPSAISDKVTVDGAERELTGEELRAVKEIYSEASERVSELIESEFYKSLDTKQRAKAVRGVYTLYKDLAFDSVLGTERDRESYILAKLLPGEVLVSYNSLSVIESDKDESGKTVSGSKKEKVVAEISALDISRDEQLMLIAARGYSLDYSDEVELYSYIGELTGITEAERLALYEECGFEVADGVAKKPEAPKTKAKTVKKVGKLVSLGSGGKLGSGVLGGGKLGSGGGLSSGASTRKIVKIGRVL